MNIWTLLVGDVLVMVLFAFLGRTEHQEGSQFLQVIQTAAPFAIGWIVAALVLRTLRMENFTRYKSGLLATFLTWLVGVPLGLMFRGIYLSRSIPTTFFIVAMISTFVLIFAWRLIFITLKRRAGQ